MTNIIVSNQVECLSCGDRPYSAHRHDFKYCKCGNVAVDGGQAYLRRVYNNTNWKEISIKIPEEAVNKAIEEVEEAIKTGRNARGLVYAALRGLRDGGFTFPDNNI